MTQKDKLLKEIANRLNLLCDRLLSYKKVDATLSEETLIETLSCLTLADNKLEEGFVMDSCKEVEEKRLIN